jgi:hypothetical protein
MSVHSFSREPSQDSFCSCYHLIKQHTERGCASTVCNCKVTRTSLEELTCKSVTQSFQEELQGAITRP